MHNTNTVETVTTYNSNLANHSASQSLAVLPKKEVQQEVSNFSGLSMLQIERNRFLKREVGEALAFKLVTEWMTEQGRNSYSNICNRLRAVKNASGVEREYLSDLAGRFSLGESYTVDRFIDLVFDARQSAGMDLFSSKIFESCVNEASKCLIFDTVTVPCSGGSVTTEIVVHASLISR